MPDPKSALNNPELFESSLAIVQHTNPAHLSSRLKGLQVSSRPKRSLNWGSQDRAAISFLKAELDLNHLETAYQKANEATLTEEGGCSATTLLMRPDAICVAWLGDSPAFLAGIDSAGKIAEIIGLNEPHAPIYETDSITKKGGMVTPEGRLDLRHSAQDQINNYSLSMSRAFGNQWLGNLLNRQPSLISFPVNQLSTSLTWYAVVGSDGILPESERSLLHPGNPETNFSNNDIIIRSAQLFQQLVNKQGQPWLNTENRWASDVTQIAQTELFKMEQTADKQLVGYPAVDDTTLIIAPLSLSEENIALIITVADGHRNGGEITAQKTVDAIHDSLAAHTKQLS
jgi:hypothetical protein